MKIIDVKDIVPLKKGLIIRPFEKDTSTESGFLIPEQTTAATPVLGTVVAAGSESTFAVGDIVFFRRYSVDELSFMVDGKRQEVNFLTDEEVVAKIKNNEGGQE